MTPRALLLSLLAGLALLCGTTAAVAGTPDKAAIASAHPLATEAGFEVLDQGVTLLTPPSPWPPPWR